MNLPPIPRWISLPLIVLAPLLYIVIGKGILNARDDILAYIAIGAAIIFGIVLFLDEQIRRARRKH